MSALGVGTKNLLNSGMTSNPTAEIAGLYRYPVKGLSPEPLPRVQLRVGRTLPADRRYAIENGPSGFVPDAPQWMPKTNFLMLMRNERLARLQCRFEDDSNVLTIRQGGNIVAVGDLESTAGRTAIESYFAKNFAGELKGPPKLLSSRDHSFSDVARKVISVINLGSLRALEAVVGAPVHPLRFRANLYAEGWPAWHELDLVGRTLAIGAARLKVVKRIVRCNAVNVDPETAQRDLEIPQAMMRRFGHMDCGIYAEVLAEGEIGPGDTVAIEEPNLL